MNTSKLKTEQLILIIIIMMALINGLTSCSSSKVYKIKDGWSKMPTKSNLTGWVYENK